MNTFIHYFVRALVVCFSISAHVLGMKKSDDVRIEVMKVLSGHENSVYSVCFSPCGRYIASGSSDETLRLWNMKTGKCMKVSREHQDAVYSVCFSPCGTYLASGSGDATVRLWDMKTGKCIKELKGHQSSVHSVFFNPCGKYLASGSSDKTIRIWKLFGPGVDKSCFHKKQEVLSEFCPLSDVSFTFKQ